ncbi:MAG: hypothetical protein ACE15C_06850 [Phycisphaerae bacterium]
MTNSTRSQVSSFFPSIFVIACSIFVISLAVSLSAQTLTKPPVASAPAATTKPDFGVWTRNSIQPPPAIEPVKLPPLATQPGDGDTEAIYRAAIGWFDKAVANVDKLVPAAEAAADRIIAGGKVYAGGAPGFIQECFGRAGGLAGLAEWKGEYLDRNDVLIIGQLGPREEGERSAAVSYIARSDGHLSRSGLVIHVASHQWPGVARILGDGRERRWGGRLFLIDTLSPGGGSWADVSLDQMATLATAWALQGEIFAAVTRKGKTLATLESICAPNNDKWNKPLWGKNINPAWTLPPVPAGKVARDYLLTCQRRIVEFLESGEAKQVRLAGSRMAATMKRGGVVMTIIAGHVHVQGGVIPRSFRNMAMFGRDWEWHDARGVLKSGDMLYYMAYLDYPRRYVDDALAAGADAVTVAVGEGPTDERRTHIRGHWAQWDSCVNILDYPVRILPVSGVVQTPQWYSLIAEAEKALCK